MGIVSAHAGNAFFVRWVVAIPQIYFYHGDLGDCIIGLEGILRQNSGNAEWFTCPDADESATQPSPSET